MLINVNYLYHLVKKTNSIILNYDESSYNLFKWYQQLVAESLGKNQMVFFQLYLICQKIITA